MKKILVTAVGGDIGYGVIKALKASTHDLYIIGCDIKKYNISYDLVNEFTVCPAYRDAGVWLDFMTDMIEQNRIDYFWPVTEPEIKIIHQNPGVFKDTTVVMNRPNVLDVAMDKGETARFLGEHGVWTPKTLTSVPSGEQKYPMIVKEKFGCGSHSVKKVQDISELRQAFQEMEDPIVQEYIGESNEEYTLTVFSDGVVTNSIAFQRELGFGGMSRYVELSHDEKLSVIAEKIARMFDLHGSVNVQLRKSGEEYCVFEINPRISSTIGFRMQLGFNDVSWWIDMLENKPVAPYKGVEGTVYGARTVEEKIFRV
ncbi:MAG: ATP-grasp domain-containing protein [Lachnospiraceae bacterium]|nr:ATP-grasp domain-containing protein [Lachnospiraceae bacterium]